jgi:hypothetical protein
LVRLHIGVLSLCILLSSNARAADCAERFTALQFEDQLGAAESALAGLNLAQFRANLDRADQMIPCLDERIPPPVAATYHRFYGLRAYGERNPMAEKAFAAARYLEPGYAFSRALIPDGNPVRKAFDEVSFEPRLDDLLEAPNGGAIYLDGSRSLRRPTEWPTLMQWIETDTVQFSTYLKPSDEIPNYPLSSEVASPGDRDPSTPLVAAAAGSAVVAASLYGIAMVNQHRYKDLDDPVPDAELSGLRRTTNGLVIASGVSAAVAVGAGVAVVATW